MTCVQMCAKPSYTCILGSRKTKQNSLRKISDVVKGTLVLAKNPKSSIKSFHQNSTNHSLQDEFPE